MSSLQDLRSTLDRHALGVADDTGAASRVSAVRGRARRARQRRAGAVVVGAVLAVVGVVLVPSLGGRSPQPAAAPETMTSLGWTYRLASTVAGDSGEVVRRLPASETPRLVSWATVADAQRVVVRQPGVPSRTSGSGDYVDFVWVPPGPSTRVSVSPVGGGGLDVAVYELDASVPPPGVGEGVLTFRDYVGGTVLLGARLGEPGEASIEVDLTPADRTVLVASACEALPAGTRVHLGWADGRGSLSSGACDSGSSFDPGGSPGMGFPPGRRAGRDSTLRMWLTRDGRRVADGELADVRLGLGAYTATSVVMRVAGVEVTELVEHDGRVWRLDQLSRARGRTLPRAPIPSDGGRYAVMDAVAGRGALRTWLAVDGRRLGPTVTYLGSGGGGGGLTPVEPGSRVTLEVGTPLERLDAAGLAVYRLSD